MKKFTQKLALIIIITAIVIPSVSFASTQTNPSRDEIIASIMQKIAELQTQLQKIKDKEVDKDKSESAVYDYAKIQKDDFAMGNPDGAKFTIVTYADFECPFCKTFHTTAGELADMYGDDFAWIHRNYPLSGAHANAQITAETAECVAKIKGERSFWKFVDYIYENSPQSLEQEGREYITDKLNITKGAMRNCLISTYPSSKVQEDVVSAAELANKSSFGTPYSLLLVNGKLKYYVEGAQPFEVISKKFNAFIK